MNENELARIRRAQRPDCYQRSGKGIPAFVGQVTTTQSLIGIGKVLVVARCQPLAPADTEGSTPTFGMDGANGFATLIGPGTPNTGDYVLVERTDYRWVTEHPNATTHGGRVVIPGCPCPTSPITLTMTSSAPASNNHILQSATLTYGPTPAALAALGIGQSAYLSTATFTDFSTGDQFWYYLSCYLGYYILTRVYATSLYGSPYHDGVRYRWPISDPSNSCNPFALNTGQIFSGGDPSCVVTITAGGTQQNRGPFTPGSFNSHGAGTYAWTNLNDINVTQTSGTRGIYASLADAGGSITEDAISATAFNANIPSNATITGITLTINRGFFTTDPNAGTQGPTDLSVTLQYQGATLGTANKANTVSPWPDYGDTPPFYYWSNSNQPFTEIDYGGGNDTWGAQLTPAIVNDPTFGILFSAQRGPLANATICVRNLTIAIATA